jgi:chemotaxis protein CheD
VKTEDAPISGTSVDASSDAGARSGFHLRAADAVTVHLHAGQLFASSEASEIWTVLGSCVSVCLFDRMRGIGGANHYLLPQQAAGAEGSPRFGSAAILKLVQRMLALGSHKHDLVAKVFGGASLMGSPAGADSLGWKNVEVARTVLSRERIPIAVEDVGGRRARRLVFRTDQGVGWIKEI